MNTMSNNPFHPSNHLLVGNKAPYLLVCRECNCRDSVIIIDLKLPQRPWVTTLKCTKNNSHPLWFICKICNTQRNEFKDMKQLKSHHYRCHLPPKKNVEVDHVLFNGNKKRTTNTVDVKNDSNEMDYVNENLNEKETSSKIEFNFSNEACNEYFSHQFNNNNGDSHLVSNGCFNGEVDPIDIDDTEKKLILLITNLSMVLTRDQYSLVTSILVLHEEVIKKRCYSKMHPSNKTYNTSKIKKHKKLEESQEYCKVQIPRTPAQLRSITTNRKKSVLKSLPIPEIEKIGDHTYLSIIHIISDILAHGHSIANITSPINDNVTSLCSSPLVRNIKERGNYLHEGFPVVNLYIIEWSDAFEPNHMKNNRNSVWVKTVTVSPVNKMSNNSHHNTYPLSFGPKNSCHEIIEKRFKADLIELKSGGTKLFYNSKTKSMCRVHAELVISIQDQPERRAENHVALGKSNYTPRWGYLLHVNKVKNSIIPCNICEEVLLSNENKTIVNNRLKTCNKCTSWSYESANNILHYDCPQDYPKDISTELFPKKQSFQQLIKATSMVHNKRVLGIWNKEQSRSYMTSEGINTVTQNAILFNAANCTVLNNLDSEDANVREAISREIRLCPSSFSQWTCSSWTRGMEIWQHVEAVMHLVFHGIQKTNMILIELWASRCGSQSALQRFGSTILQEIKELNLDWCKLLPYTGGKFGGWMAENYLAMARVNCWFYSMIHTLPLEKKYAGDPIKCQTKWMKTENQAWLRARGIRFDAKATASVLSLEVAKLIISDEVPQIIPRSTYAASHVQDLMYHSCTMIKLVMSRKVNEEYLTNLDNAIKVFLTQFNKFDESIKIKKKEKPQWISSYNYLCLLNLPLIAKSFGPLKNIWEGGYIGEGYLRIIKPYMKRGLGKNWEQNIHRGVLERKTFDFICKQYIKKEVDETKKYNIYYDKHEVKRNLLDNKTLSCVENKDGTFVFVLKNAKHVYLNIGILKEQFNHLYYFEMDMEENIIVNNFDINNIKSHCLLLPRLNTLGLPSKNNVIATLSTYTIISDDWKELDEHKQLK